MDNIPVVVSNSCLKRKKKKIQELISDAETSEQIENQKQIQMRKILIKEYLLHSRYDADCSRRVHTHTNTHTPNTHTFLFPIKLQVD